MKHLFKGLLVAGALLFAVSPAWADTFSVSVDAPVGYSYQAAGVSKDKVSGVIVGVSLPILLGFGGEAYKVTGKAGGFPLEEQAKMLDLYLDVPFPVLNLRLGGGVGKADVTVTGGPTFDSAKLSQLYVNLGYPFWEVLDVHVGYHLVRGKADVSGGGGSLTLDANMLTVGLKVGF
jgi:hypothetical protein